MRGFACICLVMLAGCAQSGEPEPVPSEAPEAPQAPAPLPSLDNDTVPEVNNTKPVISLHADTMGGWTPFNVTLQLNGTDDDGDALAWNLTLDGVQVANGTALPGNHTLNFTQSGNHTVALHVTDGTEEVSEELIIVAQTYIPLAFDITDPSGDGAAGPVDVVRFRAWVTQTTLELRIHVDDLPPASDSDTSMAWRYRVFVGEHQFENFNFVGPQTWDTTNGNYIGGTSWDPDADEVSMSIELELLGSLGLVAPYDVKMESGLGHLALGPHVPVDPAPDTGTAPVG